MMKFKLLLSVVSITFLLWVLAVTVLAQGEPPPPYAGLNPPFPWSDTSAQEAGKKLYQQSCLSCHGANGGNLAGADFSAVDYPQSLEEKPDFYFWVLSEGRLDKGMPPFKSSLSEEQRWQVLTYLWSLGETVPSEVPPPPAQPPGEEAAGTLLLTVLGQAMSGQQLTLTAILRDNQGKPVESALVKFFINVEYFTIGLMEIGEAVTNDQGAAVFKYTPRQTGETQIVARYEVIETVTMLAVADTDELFYQTEVGLHSPSFGGEVFIGPESSLELGEEGTAPMTALRIPRGLVSWPILAYVFAMILVWGFYLRVMYHMMRIPGVRRVGDTDTRLIPLVGMAVMGAFVIFLVLILITGPYSHFHLPR